MKSKTLSLTSFAIFALVAGLLYQNCGNVRLLGDGTQDFSQTLDPPLPTLPEFGETTTTTQPSTTTTLRACGSFEIRQRELPPNSAGIVKLAFEIFRTDQNPAGTPYTGFRRWNSNLPSNSSNADSTFITDQPQTCSPSFVSAEINNTCNERTTIQIQFLPGDCPPALPAGPLTCAQRHRHPSDTREMGFAQRAEPGGPTRSADPTNLIKAFWGLTQTMTPAEQAQFIYRTRAPSVTLLGSPGKYLALEFFTKASGDMYLDISMEQSWMGSDPVLISISDCEGDFYISREANGCLSSFSGISGMSAFMNRTISFPSCQLEPNKKYYMNITASIPRNNWTPTTNPRWGTFIGIDTRY